MNVETFKTFKNSPELENISNEIISLINLFSGGKKFNKNQLKQNGQFLKNPKFQLLKDKIQNKVNLTLNKLSELNMSNLLVEFIENLGKINEADWICIQRAFYLKMQSDINFIKIYLDFFKIISNVYKSVFNFDPIYFYSIIEIKIMSDYLSVKIPMNKNINDEDTNIIYDYVFLTELQDESKRINNLIIIKNLINLNMLTSSIKTDLDLLILKQDNYYADIYYWFQNESLSNEYKQLIHNKTTNNTMPLREKVLLDNLINVKKVVVEKSSVEIKVKPVHKTVIKSYNEMDTLKIETENIIEEYLSMEYLEEVKIFIEEKCKDALTKNKFCQYVFNIYFESSSENSMKILDLVRTLVKKQILFKSNLSRGILLIRESSKKLDKKLDKKMEDLLLCLKNMGITKFLESLLKEYKISFNETTN